VTRHPHGVYSPQFGCYAESSGGPRNSCKTEARLFGAKHQNAESRAQVDKGYGRDGHKYLTPEQVDALIKAAKDKRHGLRDSSTCAGARSTGRAWSP
jgi:hypothetical protein